MEAATGYSVIHEEKSLRKENSRGKLSSGCVMHISLQISGEILQANGQVAKAAVLNFTKL